MRFSVVAAMLLAFGLMNSAQGAAFVVQIPVAMTVAPGGTTTETISFTYIPMGGDPATLNLQSAVLPVRVQQGTGGATLPTLSGFDFNPGAGFIFDSLAGGSTLNESSGVAGNTTTFQAIVLPFGTGAAPHTSGSLMNLSITAGAGVTPGTYLFDFNSAGRGIFALPPFGNISGTPPTTWGGGTLTVTPEPGVITQIMGIFGVAAPILLVRRWRKKRRAVAA